MYKKFFFIFCLTSLAIHAQEVKQPEEIEAELSTAEQEFEIAKKMFIPWYTGPLITGSAHNVPKGHINIQPYLFLTVNHATYNNHRKVVDTPNTYIVNPQFVFQAGLTTWLDATVIPQALFKWQKNHFADNVGDTTLQFGFQVVKEKPYVPSVRLVLGEVFPTGKYQHLSSKKGGLDGTGGGAYVTSFGINISKVFWQLPLHPVAIRFAQNYNIADAKVHVRDFNAYGGGFDTNGRIKDGDTYNADLGIEVSLTEKWVAATDICYTYSRKTTFSGKPGVTAAGAPAANGAPSSDQLSLAPAIEYNVSENGGFIGGVWFSVTGRNSADFASIVLSYTQLF